jgi:hypothetical protein
LGIDRRRGNRHTFFSPLPCTECISVSAQYCAVFRWVLLQQAQRGKYIFELCLFFRVPYATPNTIGAVLYTQLIGKAWRIKKNRQLFVPLRHFNVASIISISCGLYITQINNLGTKYVSRAYFSRTRFLTGHFWPETEIWWKQDEGVLIPKNNIYPRSPRHTPDDWWCFWLCFRLTLLFMNISNIGHIHVSCLGQNNFRGRNFFTAYLAIFILCA